MWKILGIIVGVLVSTGELSAASALVKMSRSKICHDIDSPFYEKVKNFTAYKSLEACLAVPGSRLPRGTGSRRTTSNSTSGYDRSLWEHWLDSDGDCQNTRHELLISKSLSKVKLSPDGCYVSKGLWRDPYSGKSFSKPSLLQIDHVIPLHWASTHGGRSWSRNKKARFANDWDNLLVVKGSLNQSKGAKGPTEWMPPFHEYRCEYVAQWTFLLGKYHSLQMTASEKRVFSKMQRTCNVAS